MNGDEFELSDLDDAIIEDTVHCKLCSRPYVLGGNDVLVMDGIFESPCLCICCAEIVTTNYKSACKEMGVCEHGVNDGDWCERCNAEHKRAAKENGLEKPHDP